MCEHDNHDYFQFLFVVAVYDFSAVCLDAFYFLVRLIMYLYSKPSLLRLLINDALHSGFNEEREEKVSS